MWCWGIKHTFLWFIQWFGVGGVVGGERPRPVQLDQTSLSPTQPISSLSVTQKLSPLYYDGSFFRCCHGSGRACSLHQNSLPPNSAGDAWIQTRDGDGRQGERVRFTPGSKDKVKKSKRAKREQRCWVLKCLVSKTKVHLCADVNIEAKAWPWCQKSEVRFDNMFIKKT